MEKRRDKSSGIYNHQTEEKGERKWRLKIIMLVIFFGVMIGVGVYCRKHATDVNGFVLGGRNVGPWLTAFAYGTSYFSAVIFIGYAGQFGWKFGLASTWIGLGNAIYRFPACMECTWQTDENNEPAFRE